MTIKNIKAGRSLNRFANCNTVEQMKAKLTGKETIGIYTYGGGKQVEVRTVNSWGRRVIVATAELA